MYSWTKKGAFVPVSKEALIILGKHICIAVKRVWSLSNHIRIYCTTLTQDVMIDKAALCHCNLNLEAWETSGLVLPIIKIYEICKDAATFHCHFWKDEEYMCLTFHSWYHLIALCNKTKLIKVKINSTLFWINLINYSRFKSQEFLRLSVHQFP